MPSDNPRYRKILGRDKVHDLSLVTAIAFAGHMSSLSLAIGGALFALSFLLQIWSKAALRRDKELCATGPYSLCQHPFYLANALLDLGLLAMSGFYWLLAIYPLLFILAYLPTVRREEDVLRELFGQAHEEFCRTTGRFLPRSLRIFRDWRCLLSWKVFLIERQLSRTIRHLAFPLLVLLAGRIWAVPAAIWTPTNFALAGTGVTFIALALGVHKTLERKCSGSQIR